MKICTTCKKEKLLNEFYKNGKGYINSYCKICSIQKSKDSKERYKKETGIPYGTQWKRDHKEAAKKHDKDRTKRIKLAFVTAYGGKCTCCGEHRIEFLTLEHINHDGKEHRQKVGGAGYRGGQKIYLDVLAQGCPDTYTLYCMNCQFAEKNKKPCPHKVENQQKVLPFTLIKNTGE